MQPYIPNQREGKDKPPNPSTSKVKIDQYVGSEAMRTTVPPYIPNQRKGEHKPPNQAPAK